MSVNTWQEIHVDQEVYTISSKFVDGKWKIMLTNLAELWIYVASRAEVIDKCQSLNPLLSIEDVDIDKIITEIMNNIPQLSVEVTKRNIKLETTVEGGLFKYEIDFIASSPQELWLEIMMPMCLDIMELERQKEILIKEIRRKDEEILEYRANGAELLRKHIQTQPFTDDLIRVNTRETRNDLIKQAWLSRNQRQSAISRQSNELEKCSSNSATCKKRKIESDSRGTEESEVDVQEVVKK